MFFSSFLSGRSFFLALPYVFGLLAWGVGLVVVVGGGGGGVHVFFFLVSLWRALCNVCMCMRVYVYVCDCWGFSVLLVSPFDVLSHAQLIRSQNIPLDAFFLCLMFCFSLAFFLHKCICCSLCVYQNEGRINTNSVFLSCLTHKNLH